MVVTNSNENIPAAIEDAMGLACSVCETGIANMADALQTQCRHTFHKECITSWLKTSPECPNCEKMCHSKDLIPPRSNIDTTLRKNQTTSVQSFSSRPQTRSQSQGRSASVAQASGFQFTQITNPLEGVANIHASNANEDKLAADNQLPLLDLDQVQFSNTSNNQNSSHNSKRSRGRPRRSNRRRDNPINAEQISQIVESVVARTLGNMNISTRPQQQLPPTCFNNHSQNVSNSIHFQPQSAAITPTLNSSFATSSNLSPDKVTNIIQSWNVRFDGSSNGLRCEEFIYRIPCLTSENFNNNFDLVCKNLNI